MCALRIRPMRLACVAMFVLAESISAMAASVVVRVSPGGDISSPAAARDALRRIRAENGGVLPPGGAEVVFADGTYFIGEPIALLADDSGTKEAPVLWRAEHPGKAVFTGGRELHGWRKLGDGDEVRSRIPSAVRDKVLVADLEYSGDVPDFGGGSEEQYAKRLNYPLWLYQAGQRLPCARWPDAPCSPDKDGEGYAYTGPTVGGGTNAGNLGARSTSGMFEFDTPKLSAWAKEPDLWAYGLFLHEYADMKMAVTNVDVAAKTLSLDVRWYDRGFKKEAPFFVFNAFSELDRPGEWVLDRKNKKVYLYPAADMDVSLPVMGETFDIVCATGLRDFTFDGITFEHPRRDAMRFAGCRNVTVRGCAFRLTGAWAVRVDGGEMVRVEDSAMSHLGEGGVCLSGGDAARFRAGEHVACRCDISDFGEVIPSYRPGVALWGDGNCCLSNRISRTRHQGVFFNGNDHLIKGNEIADTCLFTDDAGAIYCCQRDWTKRGTVIADNTILRTGKRPDPTANFAIYLDDFSSGTTVRGNLVDGGSIGVYIGGGNGNTVISNEIRNCETSLHIGSRRGGHFGGVHEKGRESVLMRRLTSALNSDSAGLLRKRYPDLARIAELDDMRLAHDPVFNTVCGNRAFRSGAMKFPLAKDVGALSKVEGNVCAGTEMSPAGPAVARIDIHVAKLSDGIEVIAADMDNCELLASQKGRRVYAKLEQAREDWKEYRFAFTAQCDAKATLALSGSFGRETEYADVEVSGRPRPFNGIKSANHDRQVVSTVSLAAGERIEVRFKARAKQCTASGIAVAWRNCGITDKGRRWNAEAAADLTNVLSRTMSCPVPLIEEGNGEDGFSTVIYLGDTAAARKAGLDASKLKRGECRIKTVQGKAYLLANCGMGASAAVSEFLDRFAGFRFFLPGDGNPVKPNPAWAFPADVDIVCSPAIYAREIYHGVTDGRKHPQMRDMWMKWSRRLMALVTDEIEGRYRLSYNVRDVSGKTMLCHSSFCYLPPEKHFKDHPEWYSMVKGKRQCTPTGQLCMTNPDVREECLKSLRRFIEADRSANPSDCPAIYDFTQQDNMQALCQCPECMKIIAKYNRVPGGHEEGGDTGLQLEFINDIARRIAQEHPDVFLRIFAYSSTEALPGGEGIRPEKNVIVWYCDAYNFSDHDRPLSDSFNSRSRNLLSSWLDLAPRLQLWDYALYGNRTTGSYPDVFPSAIASDARLFASKGLESIFMETEYHNQPFYELNFYLMSRMYTDPSRDVWEELRDFCRVYGKGASPMIRAINTLCAAIAANPPPGVAAWRQKTLPWRGVETYDAMLPDLTAAHGAAETTSAKALVARVLAATWRDLAQAYKTCGIRDSRYAQAKNEFLRFVPEAANALAVDDASRAKFIADEREAAELMDLKFADLPSEMADVPDDELVCVDYHKFYANPGAKRVEDTESTTGRAVVYLAPKNMKAPFSCGVYDADTKTGQTFSISNIPQDEKYHWHKLGDVRIGRTGNFWMPRDWLVNVWLRDYYMMCDGMSIDPNWYELWVSIKVQGPTNVKGSSKPDGLYLDRLVFRRKARDK